MDLVKVSQPLTKYFSAEHPQKKSRNCFYIIFLQFHVFGVEKIRSYGLLAVNIFVTSCLLMNPLTLFKTVRIKVKGSKLFTRIDQKRTQNI